MPEVLRRATTSSRRRATLLRQFANPLHAHRRGGHNHRPVDAVLSALLDICGKGLHSPRVSGIALTSSSAACSRRRSPGSSLWPARQRSISTAFARFTTPPMALRPCDPGPANTPTSSSPPACVNASPSAASNRSFHGGHRSRRLRFRVGSRTDLRTPRFSIGCYAAAHRRRRRDPCPR